MFALEIAPVGTTHTGDVTVIPNERTAIVGFSGPMRGSCRIHLTLLAAVAIASAMLGGVPVGSDDECVNDAIGELCNMFAGGWKNSIPALSSECSLSPPTVISGNDYKVHFRKPFLEIGRTYQFGSHLLHLILQCEGGCTASSADGTAF